MKTKSQLTPGLALRAVDGAGSARAEHGEDVRTNHAERAVNAAALATTDDAFPRNTSEPASPKPAATPAPAKNTTILSDASPFGQGPSGAEPRSARLHLVIGPVGAGKSTFALQLAREHAAVRLTLDEWMARLFRDDRPETDIMSWYVERAARCVEQIWALARAMSDVGTGAVLEIGLLQRAQRESFYRRVAEAGRALSVYVLDASREVRRERVQQRNRARGATFSMVVPEEVFELASDLWEPPDVQECAGRDMRFIHTGG